MTAAHCLDRPGQQITLRFRNGTTAQGKVLGVCPTLDIGLVKITETGKRLALCRERLLRESEAWSLVRGRGISRSVPQHGYSRRLHRSRRRGGGTWRVVCRADGGGRLRRSAFRPRRKSHRSHAGNDGRRRRQTGHRNRCLKKNWQRLLGSEFWEVVLPEVEERSNLPRCREPPIQRLLSSPSVPFPPDGFPSGCRPWRY